MKKKKKDNKKTRVMFTRTPVDFIIGQGIKTKNSLNSVTDHRIKHGKQWRVEITKKKRRQRYLNKETKRMKTIKENITKNKRG